jgi:hypothetical protein
MALLPANPHLRRRARAGAWLTLVALAVTAGGCGGGGKSKSSTTSTPAASHSATAPATSSTAPSNASGVASVTTGPVRATLHAPNHSPTAKKLWPYSVKVTDPSGKPLPGTVDTEFLFGGQVVGHEAPPTHRLNNGALRDAVTWPAQAVGEPLALRVVVHAGQRTITLDWPVSVKR